MSVYWLSENGCSFITFGLPLFIWRIAILIGCPIACKRRRISSCHLVPLKNNVCEPEPENDFCDIGILSQSQFSSNNPKTIARGIRCEEHSSFILSWNLIGQGETKVITSQKSFSGSGSQTLLFDGTKWQPEIRLRLQASCPTATCRPHNFQFQPCTSASKLIA